MNINLNSKSVTRILGIIQHYNPDKYWRRREYVVQPGGNKLLKYLYLIYIKRCDAFNKASMGTNLNDGAVFETAPLLPHGLNGIIVASKSHIGKNCVMYHQVTIGNDNRKAENAPIIGDNVTIYPGAKIVGKVKIGNNCEIGANAVVTRDVPDNSLVVTEKVRVIERNKV